MKYKELREEVGHMITLGALIEKMQRCATCKHMSIDYAPGYAYCCNPEHDTCDETDLKTVCINWELF